MWVDRGAVSLILRRSDSQSLTPSPRGSEGPGRKGDRKYTGGRRREGGKRDSQGGENCEKFTTKN